MSVYSTERATLCTQKPSKSEIMQVIQSSAEDAPLHLIPLETKLQSFHQHTLVLVRFPSRWFPSVLQMLPIAPCLCPWHSFPWNSLSLDLHMATHLMSQPSTISANNTSPSPDSSLSY